MAITRRSIESEIASLDPKTDHQRIVYLMSVYLFPFDSVRALEFALFRTYAIPSIGALLGRTGEFTRRTRKRYDDTDLLFSEWTIHGYDSERGREAIRRMNQQHHRFNIANDDYLYVLSTIIFEPLRWRERYCYRPPTDNERLAWFYFWVEVGKRMNIQHLPDSYAAFEAWNLDYERAHFGFDEGGRAVGNATRDLMLGWVLPKALYPLGEPFIYALMDDPLLRAYGYPKQPAWLRALVAFGMRARSRVSSWLPLRQKPFLRTELKRELYPNGYTIDMLGGDRP